MESCLVSFESKISLSWGCKSFDDLPKELVVNILSRLPVKTLVVSTAVSKIWYSLIKSASFISAHLSRSVSDPSKYYIFLCNNSSPSVIVISDNLFLTRHSDFNLPFETKFKDQTLIGACNALLCLTDYSDYHGHDIYLLNPFIYKFKKLDEESSCYADLIKDINYKTGYIRIGFGYCEVENDYKVLRIINRYYDTSFCVGSVKVEIYSLKSGKWKWKGIDVSFKIEIDSYICVAFVHGCLYWRVNHYPPELAGPAEADEYLLCFDLKDEVFSKIELPTTCRQFYYKWDCCILDKDGFVAIVGLTIKDRNSISPFVSICVLVLEKDLFGQFQWKELYYECSDSFLSALMGCRVKFFSVMGFSGVGRLILEGHWNGTKYMIAVDLDNSCAVEKLELGRLVVEGYWDGTKYMVAVDLDNSCAVEKLELASVDFYDGGANVVESLFLFSDSPN